MRLTTYPTGAAFLDAVRPTLAEHEVEHHLVLGVAEAAATDHAPNAGLFAASVDDVNGLALAAFMTRDRPLLIASDRADVTAASSLLWDALCSDRLQPRHVIGAAGQIEGAVAEWANAAGRQPKVAMRQCSYKLTSVDPLPSTSGILRVASLRDLDLVAEWISEFEAEA